MKKRILTFTHPALLLSFAVVLLWPYCGRTQTTLTFSVPFEDKLFINSIPLGKCGALLTATASHFAAFIVLCQATSLAENPPTGALVAPLDARIRSGVDLQWQCKTGNPAPIGLTGVASLAHAAGPEPLGFVGVVNNPTSRDNIATKGTWGAVFSGHPQQPLPEAAFQSIRTRTTTDIWQHLTGTIACATNNRGLPTSSMKVTLVYTAFPSHKVWYRSPAKAPAAALLFNVPQGLFSALWALPAVPAP